MNKCCQEQIEAIKSTGFIKELDSIYLVEKQEYPSKECSLCHQVRQAKRVRNNGTVVCFRCNEILEQIVMEMFQEMAIGFKVKKK